jgi:hypothetical protein
MEGLIQVSNVLLALSQQSPQMNQPIAAAADERQLKYIVNNVL